MGLDFSLLDAFLLLLAAIVVVFCAKRGVAAFVVAVLMLLFWGLLNTVGLFFAPWAACVLALGAGALASLLARQVMALNLVVGLGDSVRVGLGAVGGVVLAFAFVCSVALGFPTKPNPALGNFFYPSPSIHPMLEWHVRHSAINRFLSNDRSSGGLGMWNMAGPIKRLVIPDRSK